MAADKIYKDQRFWWRVLFDVVIRLGMLAILTGGVFMVMSGFASVVLTPGVWPPLILMCLIVLAWGVFTVMVSFGFVISRDYARKKDMEARTTYY